jgi:hypothetical protein
MDMVKNNNLKNRPVWMIAMVALVVVALATILSFTSLSQQNTIAGLAAGYDNPEGDADKDGIRNDIDNCPGDYNPDQRDYDKDRKGDECDYCPYNYDDPTIYLDDTDFDYIGDLCDNCPNISNTDQSDIDKDGIGDKCDDDTDGDGRLNNRDACPKNEGPCEEDLDGDNIIDLVDRCVNYLGDESTLSKNNNRMIVNYSFDNETGIGINKAIYFNGSKYNLVLPKDSADGTEDFMNNFNDFTITFWVKTNNLGEQCIFSMPYYQEWKAKKGLSLCLAQNITLYTPYIYDKINYSLKDNKWHFVVITRNNTDIKINLDNMVYRYSMFCGTLKSEAFVLGAEGYYDDDSEFGKLKVKNNFIGSVDELKVYNYVLNSAEINQIFKPETLGLLKTSYLESKK